MGGTADFIVLLLPRSAMPSDFFNLMPHIQAIVGHLRASQNVQLLGVIKNCRTPLSTRSAVTAAEEFACRIYRIKGRSLARRMHKAMGGNTNDEIDDWRVGRRRRYVRSGRYRFGGRI
jgi:hypothetical protein